jgi:uncharacterized membrane protein SpoIIM required for sporulation
MALNAALLALALLAGFRCGEPGSIAPSLPQMRARLSEVKGRAARNTVQVVGNNVSVGGVLSLAATMPLYGPAVATWKLGFPLGALARSMIDGVNRPSAIALALLLPHGVPEYAGFTLMLNSVTMWHFALAGALRGRRPQWTSLLRYGAASLAAGCFVLGAAAVVECYITPAIVGLLMGL